MAALPATGFGSHAGDGTPAGRAASDEQDPLRTADAAHVDSPDRQAGRRISDRAVSISARVLVLNAGYEPINVCTVRRAVVLLLKERAEVLEQYDRCLRSENVTISQPAVIRLVNYVRLPRRHFHRRITRRAVFARDQWSCQYCGSGGALTVDHVIPRSKGGQTTWDNIVTSCAGCNRRKGDRLPKQVGMHPREAPRPPNSTIFIHVASPTIPAPWQQYIVSV